MPPHANPLRLNPLQLRTLALFQEMARQPQFSSRVAGTDDVLLNTIPRPHGDHFHLGDKLVAARDASGLGNSAVWVALERKGLLRGAVPFAVTLTRAGQDYAVGAAADILRRGDH